MGLGLLKALAYSVRDYVTRVEPLTMLLKMASSTEVMYPFVC